jgi:DNA-3-methyladenine glycosylase II
MAMKDVSANAPLTSRTLKRGVRELSRRDTDLARVVDGYGTPPMWGREPGFAALVLIILEQQVSLASARAVFDRLAAIVTPLSAERLLALDDAILKGAGLTRQKLSYCKYLAEAIVAGELRLDALGTMQDTEARATLMRVKGIGPWTADIYLLMALRRRDIWPEGDLALRAAMQAVKALPKRPSHEAFTAIGEAWRPWRAVAARILWHYYLQKRGQKT